MTRALSLWLLTCLAASAAQPVAVMAHRDGALATPTNFYHKNLFAGTNIHVEPYSTNGAVRINVTGALTGSATSVWTNGVAAATGATNLNFIAGTNVVLLVTNTSGKVDIEINSASGSGDVSTAELEAAFQSATNYSISAFQSGTNYADSVAATAVQTSTNYSIAAFQSGTNYSDARANAALQAATNYSISAFQSGTNYSDTVGANAVQASTNYSISAFQSGTNFAQSAANSAMTTATNYSIAAFQSSTNYADARAATAVQTATNYADSIAATAVQTSTNYALSAWTANSNATYALSVAALTNGHAVAVALSNSLSVAGAQTNVGDVWITDSKTWLVRTNLGGAIATNISALVVSNATPALTNAQQQSPMLLLVGNAFNTGAAVVSNVPTAFALSVLPVQATSSSTLPTANLIFSKSVSNATPTEISRVDSSGNWTASGSGAFGGTVSAASSSYFGIAGKTRLYSAADGFGALVNNGQSDYSAIVLGSNSVSVANIPAIWKGVPGGTVSSSMPQIDLGGATNAYNSGCALGIWSAAPGIFPTNAYHAHSNGVTIFSTNTHELIVKSNIIALAGLDSANPHCVGIGFANKSQ